MSNEKRILTPNEAARILMVSPVTLRQWAQKDRIKSHTTLGGHRRFVYDEVLDFAKRENITVLDDLVNEDSPQKKVLIVDDDRSFSKLLFTMLSGKYPDWQFDNAHDGFDAGLKVQQFQPDVILMDLKLPGVQGDEVCRNIKSQPALSSTRVLGMTGHMASDTVQRFIDAGAEQVLEKPMDTDQLYALLDG